MPIDINFIKGLNLNSQHIRLLYERADIWSALSDPKMVNRIQEGRVNVAHLFTPPATRFLSFEAFIDGKPLTFAGFSNPQEGSPGRKSTQQVLSDIVSGGFSLMVSVGGEALQDVPGHCEYVHQALDSHEDLTAEHFRWFYELCLDHASKKGGIAICGVGGMSLVVTMLASVILQENLKSIFQKHLNDMKGSGLMDLIQKESDSALKTVITSEFGGGYTQLGMYGQLPNLSQLEQLLFKAYQSLIEIKKVRQGCMQAGIMMSRQLPFVKDLLVRYSKSPLLLLEEFAENQVLQTKIEELKETLVEFQQEAELIDGLRLMLKNANDVGLKSNKSVIYIDHFIKKNRRKHGFWKGYNSPDGLRLREHMGKVEQLIAENKLDQDFLAQVENYVEKFGDSFNDHQMRNIQKFLMNFHENPSGIRQDDIETRTKFAAAYELIKTCRQHEVLIDQLKGLRSRYANQKVRQAQSAVKMRAKQISQAMTTVIPEYSNDKFAAKKLRDINEFIIACEDNPFIANENLWKLCDKLSQKKSSLATGGLFSVPKTKRESSLRSKIGVDLLISSLSRDQRLTDEDKKEILERMRGQQPPSNGFF